MYGEFEAAALIDTFFIGMGDGMACRGKITPYLGETFFLNFIDNREATGIKPKNLGKARTHLTSMSIPKQGKRDVYHNA